MVLPRLAAALLALASLLPLAASAAPIRGLDPALAPRYQPDAQGQFTCLDGKKRLPIDQINDGYCDCFDGSDEPGTAACANGHFYCENKFFLPLRLNATMVDDGVCDCCDGSDEPAGKCPNTCYEKGHESLAGLKEQVATAKAGVAGRNAYKQEAEILKDQWQKRKADLEQELEAARKEQEAAEADKSRLEDQRSKLEAQKKELEEKKQKLEEEAAPTKPAEPAEPAAPAEGQQGDAEQGGEEAADADAEAAAEVAEAEAEAAAAAAGEEAAAAKSEEELARERMAQWIPGSTGGNGEEQEEQPGDEALPAYDGEDLAAADAAALAEQQAAEAEAAAEQEGQFFHDQRPDGPAAAADGGAGGGAAAGAGAGAAPGGGAGGGAGAHGQPASALGKAKRLLTKVLGALLGQKPGADVSGLIAELTAQIEKLDAELSHLSLELDPARTRASEARTQLSAKEAEQQELEEKLGRGYGEGDVFAPLADNCYSAKVDKYTYEVCPFSKAAQKEGHSSTSLGSWQGLEDGDRRMLFTNGAGCWQGPSRSMTVTLRCGQAEKLAKVEEPSRCEYTAELETPAACTQEALDALQAELAARERLLMGGDEEEQIAAAMGAAKDEL
ncbi:hypothetical protein ABPG75_001631 [Micractinium tetrahymenae]